jgi:sulfoxide reductase heme-binding subunit YedZ
MNQPIMWYASRATGVLALVLLTATVVLGALGGGRFSRTRWPRFVISAVHRNVSLLGVVFVLVHVVTAIVDPYAGIGWLDSVVPFTSVYHPFWLGLGAVTTDLLIAVVVTSLLRPRINVRLWRAVHWAGYACWPVALAHGIGIDPVDFRLGWMLALDCVCVVAVLVAVGWRAGTSHPDGEARARAAGRGVVGM